MAETLVGSCSTRFFHRTSNTFSIRIKEVKAGKLKLDVDSFRDALCTGGVWARYRC